MGTLNENEEYREQTDTLFIPQSVVDFMLCRWAETPKASEASHRGCLPLASRDASDSVALATQDYRPSL
jgi:hypothetical protein